MMQDTLTHLKQINGVFCSFVLADNGQLLGFVGEKKCDHKDIFSTLNDFGRNLTQLQFSLNMTHFYFASFHLILKKFEYGVLGVVIEPTTDVALLNITLKMALKQISKKYLQHEYSVVVLDHLLPADTPAKPAASCPVTSLQQEATPVVLQKTMDDLETAYKKAVGPLCKKLMEQIFQELQTTRERFAADKLRLLTETMAQKISSSRAREKFLEDARNIVH